MNTHKTFNRAMSARSFPYLMFTGALSFLFIMLPLLQTASAADDQNRFSIRGAGLLTCEVFEKEREAGSETYQIIGGWINGYITGVNQYAPDTFDILSFESTELVTELLSAHCKQNPNDLVFAVLNSMFIKIQDDRLKTPSKKEDVVDGDRSVKLYQEVLKRIQTRLKEKEHYKGAITGKFGAAEKEAISSFQKSVGLKSTGFPDQVTLWKLMRRSEKE